MLGFYQSHATATVKGMVTTTGDLHVDAKSINEVNLTRSFSHAGGGLTENNDQKGISSKIKGTLFGIAREFILTTVLGQLGADINSVLSEVEEYNFKFKESTPENAFAGSPGHGDQRQQRDGGYRQ